MNGDEHFDYFLIRDAGILVRISRVGGSEEKENPPEFFDVRTGVQIREIHPSLQEVELDGAHRLPEEFAGAILKSGAPILKGRSTDPSKVVNILDMKQRRLDTIVADSVLDQIRVIKNILTEFLHVADRAQPEERFWLSQQALTLVRKFSGRELGELEEMLDWFKNRPKKK
ncbi:MAG: hypothetical protein RDU20_05855 [Desulfomonilaceae bacterium]|nr:hypothetical protein [Desulfomonilaceae bacterium]